MYGLPYAFSHIIQTHAAEGILEDKLHPGKLANRVSACHECQALFLGICCSLTGNRVLRLTLCLPLNLSTRWIGAWELSQYCQVMPCLHTHTFYIFLQISGISKWFSPRACKTRLTGGSWPGRPPRSESLPAYGHVTTIEHYGIRSAEHQVMPQVRYISDIYNLK